MGSSLKIGKNFIGGSQEQKTCTLLGPKVKNAICDGTTPYLHTKPNLNKCRKVLRSKIFKQNWIILIHPKFYCIFSDLSHSGSCGCVDGWKWMRVCLGVPPPHAPTFMHMHTHMHNTKIYMYSNCKWPPPWRHPCLSCLTCMCICVCTHAHICLHGAPQYIHTPKSVKAL